MNNEQTLELEIKAKAQEAKSSVDTLVKSLTNIENVLTNVYLELGHIEKKSNTTITKNITNVRTLKSAVDGAKSSTDKLNSVLLNTFSFVGVKNLALNAIGWMNEAIDYTEQLNLFNVVFNNVEKNGKTMFSELGKEATRFQYKLNETFGTNKNETLYMQGIFQSMGETVGIGSKYSAIMSESMTKLTYDLASLYNKSEDKVAEALRAGVYAGQTKPLRAYGIDVTQTSLQPILDSLGIDEQVKNLSQAEKELLRYLATLKQAKIAMGDFANNLESPSNQMKIFKQQLVETKVALTSLFIGTFANIMPYANAFLMTIKEISKAIATMFGIELKDYNTGIASQDGIYDGIEDSANGASKAVKELRRQTLGFDEIHNINENKDNNSGTSVNGGIDQRLLDAIKGYDNGMDKVRMKATEIRDRIMDWLGFTKEIDPLTGEVSFKFKGIKTLLKNVLKSWKDTSTITKIIMGLGLVGGLTNVYKIGSKVYKLLGGSGITKVLKGLVSPMKSLYGYLDKVNFANKNLTDGLAEGISNWSKSLTKVDKFNVALGGFLGLSASMEGMADAMKSVSDEGWNLGNSLQAVASGLGGIASGAYIGSIFGPWGTVIGGAAGAVLELVSAVKNYDTETDKIISKSKKTNDKISDFLKSIEDEKETLQDSLNASLTITSSHEKLVDELESIVDANGKVKKGYEEQAKFILGTLSEAYGFEYKLIDNQIVGYDKLVDKIKESINIKKAQILSDASKEQYANDLKNETKLWAEKEKAISNYNDLQKKYNDLRDESLKYYKKNKGFIEAAFGKAMTFEEYFSKQIDTNVDGLKDLTKELNNSKIKVDDATKSYVENITRQTNYSNLQKAIMTGNYDKINDAVKQFTYSYIDEGKNVQLSLSDRIKKEQESANIILDLYKKTYGEKIPEALRNSANSSLNEIVNGLVEQTEEVKNGDFSKELLEAWATLGIENKNVFIEKFKSLPQDIQDELTPKLKAAGLTLSSALSSSIKFDGSNMFKGWNNSIGKIYEKISNISNNSVGKIFGFKLPSLSSLKIFNSADGGIYSNGIRKKIPQYANGGIPSHGSMFIAGENGAEIVGNINRRTEVLNQSQIASAIYSATLSAMTQVMSQYGGGVAEINVRASKDCIVETAINGINQETRQSGICPIEMPTY